jgi:phage gp36-like protein
MSYAVFDDVVSRYRPIITLIGSEDLQVSSVNVSSIFIRDAESFVDARIGRRYAVPLTVVPAFITQVTADIAIFNMLTDHLPGKPDFFQPRYDRALEMLSMVDSGTLSIGSASLSTTGDQEAWSTTQGYHSVFSPVLPADEQQADIQRQQADLDLRVEDAAGN